MAINHKSAFKLSAVRVHLEDGPRAQPLEITDDFWEKFESKKELNSGRLVGAFFATDPEDLHPSMWEMHPDGDELLCLCSGAIDLVLDEPSGERTVKLRAQTAYIVPPGVWHRLLLREPGLLIAITRRKGTQLRDV